MIKLSLPAIEFIDTEPEIVLNRMITKYEEMSGKKLYASDLVRLHISYMAYLIILLRTNINETAKMNLLRYAEGKYLDSLCELFYDTKRKEPVCANVTLRFKISAPQNTAVLIPKDTAVTVDGDINFYTLQNVYVKQNETEADVPAVCGIPGIIGNGFIPGQISNIITPFHLFESVVNITESAGGADEETDEILRERASGSVNSFSTAGARDSYIYHAKAVSTTIADVRAVSLSEGVVTLYVLCNNGELPSSELLNSIKKAVNADVIRPLTEVVEVCSPVIIPLEVDFTFYIDSSFLSNAAAIETAVHNAVEKYIKWQTGKIGRDINPSYLISLIINAGAKRVEVIKPVYRIVSDSQVSVLTGLPNMRNGGIEDE